MKIIKAKYIGIDEVYDLEINHDHHSFVHESGTVLHNCAYLIADEPIKNFIPLTVVSGIPVTQYTAPSVEKAGGVKVDFLNINSLKDIRNCLELIRERSSREFPDHAIINNKKVPKVRIIPSPINGELLDVWDLPEVPGVFQDICGCKTETVFQLNTNGAMEYLKLFNKEGVDIDENGVDVVSDVPLITSIEDISVFTSLGRPGALDFKINDRGENMMHEFANRKKGNIDRSSPYFIQYLEDLFPETLGVLVYQEQLQKVVQKLGGFDPLEANKFRICVGKKKKVELSEMKPKFIEGAITQIAEEEAEKIWSMMITFGQYGFNKSHAVSYSIIAYACAYLKHHFQLEWWTAVLRNATKEEIYSNFLKYCRDLIDLPDINRSGDTFVISEGRILSPIGSIEGVGEKTHENICKARPFVNIEDFVTRVDRRSVNKPTVDKLIFSGVMDSLFDKGYVGIEKLDKYAQCLREIKGDKKATVPESYLEMTPLQRYCVKKSIIPTYTTKSSEDSLAKMFFKSMPAECIYSTYELVKKDDGIYSLHDGHEYKLLNSKKLKEMDEGRVKGNFAVLGFIVNERKFSYHNNSKEAIEIAFDTDGYLAKAAVWPGKDERTPKIDFGEGFQGEIQKLKYLFVVLYISRWKPEKGFSVKGMKYICGIKKLEEK